MRRLDNRPVRADNPYTMPASVRQRRIMRSEDLASEHPASAEILDFLADVLRFQDELEVFLQKTAKDGPPGFTHPIAPDLLAKFPAFLRVIENRGPAVLKDEAQKLKNNPATYPGLLGAFWSRTETTSSLPVQEEFFARAFLQPYAEIVRNRSAKRNTDWTPRICPFCRRKPGSGVLRPLGDGGQRSLLCSFCLAEWEFRRIVCTACGEENESKLPVYTAEEFNYVRVECCDSCRTYIKTVDLTRNGLADPVVDEIAAVPLDLWAQQQGYAKLQANLLLL